MASNNSNTRLLVVLGLPTTLVTLFTPLDDMSHDPPAKKILSQVKRKKQTSLFFFWFLLREKTREKERKWRKRNLQVGVWNVRGSKGLNEFVLGEIDDDGVLSSIYRIAETSNSYFSWVLVFFYYYFSLTVKEKSDCIKAEILKFDYEFLLWKSKPILSQVIHELLKGFFYFLKETVNSLFHIRLVQITDSACWFLKYNLHPKLILDKG